MNRKYKYYPFYRGKILEIILLAFVFIFIVLEAQNFVLSNQINDIRQAEIERIDLVREMAKEEEL